MKRDEDRSSRRLRAPGTTARRRPASRTPSPRFATPPAAHATRVAPARLGGKPGAWVAVFAVSRICADAGAHRALQVGARREVEQSFVTRKPPIKAARDAATTESGLSAKQRRALAMPSPAGHGGTGQLKICHRTVLHQFN